MSREQLYRDENNVITCQPLNPEVDNRGLGVVLFEALRSYQPERLCQIEYETGKEETYAEVLRKSRRTALWLKEREIGPGSVVLICSYNQSNTFVTQFGAHFVGATTAALDPKLPEIELNHLIKEIKHLITIVFASSDCIERIQYCLNGTTIPIVTYGKTEGYDEFEECFLLYHQEEPYFIPERISNIYNNCMIYLSSGSTGLPKAICLNHYTVLTWAYEVNKPLLTDRTNYYRLIYQSPYWISNGGQTISSLTLGYCRVLCKGFDPKQMWQLLKLYKPYVLAILPVNAINMCKMKTNQDVDDVPKVLSLGGAPVTKEQVQYIRNCLPHTLVCQTYGQTETGASTTCFEWERDRNEILSKLTSCGYPYRGCQLKVVDLDTRKALGPNQPGELLVKCNFIMNGYLNQKGSEAFENDWFKTGDILYYDEDHCFFYVDRIRECLYCNGEAIWPAYIETELLKHPAVLEAVVIGIFYPEDGDHLLGLVVLHEDHSATPEELVKYIDNRLPEKFKLREGVRILKEFPRTPSGKVHRYKLKTMYQNITK